LGWFTDVESNSICLEQLRERFSAHGQDHVFRFWEELDTAARERLREQAARINLESLARAYRRTRGDTGAAPRALSPAPIERLPQHGGDPDGFARARKLGDELLAAGRVGVVVVAGGQGTRLGFEGPKGAFPIGPVTDRSLFELQAQKLRRARNRYRVALAWYVMTSPATDADTREFFQRRGFLGLPAEDVFFFCQATVPSLDFEGRLMLERPDRIAENPNGHGGSFTALADSGALDDMQSRGIDTLSYYQVDNPLVRLADPVLLGFHRLRDAEMSCKVVHKRTPEENMGVLALIDGRIGIVEYTELDDESRFARNASGELVYWGGNLAIHALQVDFVRRIAADAERLLPLHASAKKIPCLDENGRTLRPREPNGHKLERFVFDALPAASSVAVIEIHRCDEYSPVKNMNGDDSPATAQRDLMALYRRWLEAAAVAVPEGAWLEIDHSLIDDEQDARESGIQDLGETTEGIRLASGAS
jgi:UDP-N-acetylglucosamine/UDP-N-acetylgalactosamine diphosphorylase